MVKYKNKLHPWKYIVVLPVARNPIKISAPNLSSLKPVHEGIRRVLLAQQRDRGSRRSSGGGHPQENGYDNGGSPQRSAPPQQSYSPQAYSPQQQYHQQQPQYAQQSAYNY